MTKPSNHLLTVVVFLLVSTWWSAVANAQSGTPIEKAVSVINPTGGGKPLGTVTFRRTSDGVEVVADLQNLAPGKHGFHIHEFGDCSSKDASSAGGHFNPRKVQHGAPGDDIHHTGDLGNIEAKEDGQASLRMTTEQFQLSGQKSIIGRAVIVHAEPDTFVQPSGGAGSRVGCGVIGIAS